MGCILETSSTPEGKKPNTKGENPHCWLPASPGGIDVRELGLLSTERLDVHEAGLCVTRGWVAEVTWLGVSPGSHTGEGARDAFPRKSTWG